jgi:hypothetical protein
MPQIWFSGRHSPPRCPPTSMAAATPRRCHGGNGRDWTRGDRPQPQFAERDLWNVWPLSRGSLRLEACELHHLAHFSVSLAMSSPKSTGAPGRSRQRTGRGMGDLQSCCGVVASTNRFRSRSLQLACHRMLGARSRGGKPRRSRCPHALPVCAFVRRIEITGSLRAGQRSGY